MLADLKVHHTGGPYYSVESEEKAEFWERYAEGELAALRSSGSSFTSLSSSGSTRDLHGSLRRPDELLVAGRPPGLSVGVVIRTLNEGASIGTCLETLHGQCGTFELDVLVVDSGSTDATIEIARRHGVRVVELPPGEFDYSTALNFGSTTSAETS